MNEHDLKIRKETLEEARDASCKYCRRSGANCGKSYCSATEIIALIETTERDLSRQLRYEGWKR